MANDADLAVLRLTVERAPASARQSMLDLATALTARWRSIQAFAPLPRLIAGDAPSTGSRTCGSLRWRGCSWTCRHVQVDWPLYGPKLAQVALTFGADDVDGVSPVDDMRLGRRRAPLEEIRRNIVAAVAASRSSATACSGRAADGADAHRAPSRTSTRARSSTDSDRWPDRFAVRYDLPSDVRAAAASSGEIDLGLIPSIEYLRGDGYAHRAGLRHRVRRPGRVGGALHVDADRAGAHDRARHEFADLRGADARDGGAPLRHRARVRRPSAGSGRDARAGGRGAPDWRSGTLRRLRGARPAEDRSRRRVDRRSPACRSSSPAGPVGPARWTPRRARRCRSARAPERPTRMGWPPRFFPGDPARRRSAAATCARTSGSASATANAPAWSGSSR